MKTNFYILASEGGGGGGVHGQDRVCSSLIPEMSLPVKLTICLLGNFACLYVVC